MLEQYFTEKLVEIDANYVAIKKAKQNGMKTFVFGGGHCGGIAVDALRNENLEPAGCFVTDDYWREGLSCHGVPVYRESEVTRIGREYGINIVPACIAATAEAEERLRARTRCEMLHLNFDWPHLSENHISREYVEEHLQEFDQTFQLLADEESREVFLAYLRTKAKCIHAPAVRPLREYIKEPQYTNSLLQELPDSFLAGAVIDCGAYDGDTVEQFCKALPKSSRIYAFEPDAENYMRLVERVGRYAKVKPIQRGVWSKTERLRFLQSADSGSAITAQGTDCFVDVVSLDDALPAEETVSFIKMDIEGSEAEALKGAGKIICRDMPFLAICAYHRRSDLIELPRLVSLLSKGNENYHYQFYLRQHFYAVAVGELVLYAVPRQNK